MKNNNKNDTWINLFLFFLVTDKPETVLDLIQSDNCEEEFTDIVQRIVTMDSRWFQHTCIDWLMKHREILMELNKAYKISQDVLDKVRAEVESQRKGMKNKKSKWTIKDVIQVSLRVILAIFAIIGITLVVLWFCPSMH